MLHKYINESHNRLGAPSTKQEWTTQVLKSDFLKGKQHIANRGSKSYCNTSCTTTNHLQPTNPLCSFLDHQIPNMALNLIPYFIMSFQQIKPNPTLVKQP